MIILLIYFYNFIFKGELNLMEYNPIDIFEDFELEDNKEFELPLESTSFVDLI